jgi:ParB family chromosome partitioning protein
MNAAQTVATKELDINRVRPNPNQPRQKFDEQKLQELAESIAQVGLLSPILVKPIDDHYQIIHGERRWRACQLAGLDTIRAEIREVNADNAYTMSIIENEQRENISPIETAQAIDRMMREQRLTQGQVAKRISRSRTWVAQKLRLLNLPDEVQTLVTNDNLTEGHGRQLLKLHTAGLNGQVNQLAEQASRDQWSVSRLESEVNVLIANPESVSQDTLGDIELRNTQKESASIGAFKVFWRSLTPGQQQTALEWLKEVSDG